MFLYACLCCLCAFYTFHDSMNGWSDRTGRGYFLVGDLRQHSQPKHHADYEQARGTVPALNTLQKRLRTGLLRLLLCGNNPW